MGNMKSKETTADGRSIYEREALGSAGVRKHEDGTVRPSTASGPVCRTGTHDGSINCMALSEDGSLLVTGSEDCTARLWSTKTDSTESLGALEGHTSYITCVTIMADFVISGSADQTIRKWDMVSRECVFIFEGHRGNINSVIPCGGDYILSSSYDKTARLWYFDPEGEGEESPCVRVFEGHQKPIYPILVVWTNLSDSSDSDSDSEGFGDCSEREEIIVTGSNDTTAKTWSRDSQYSLQTFHGHEQPVSCMVADEDSATLITAGLDRTIRIWTMRDAKCQRVLEGHSLSITCMQLVGRLLYSGSTDRTARAWVTEFGECTRVFEPHSHSVTCIKVVKGVVFTGCNDCKARAFDAKSGALKRTFPGHTAGISCIQYIDGKLFTGSTDGTLRVWNATNITEDQPSPEEEAEEYDKEHMAEQQKRLNDVSRRLSRPYAGGDIDDGVSME
ncbi:WD repeat-containing protein 86-like isoform X2 [Amphibalanus amphitrite]|uniref:WD repeat-containing protein 86-like isoform X2 n=1 Tax=Amphibalanus amphitrite TaxID=1232801 RepID=UPI001C912544|nr:WD repeat-containing protein 86-like isoform X2 [Amphibalanus amphitrite]